MKTMVYALAHFLVDLICAWAMFSRFIAGENGYGNILIYNFCAFALQMPLGALLDGAAQRPVLGRSGLWASAGIFVTVAGALTHPAVLGLGNALFHVGGGVGTIRQDHAKGWKGAGLGIFVAPGAMGLYIGTCLGKTGQWSILTIFAVGAIILCAMYLMRRRDEAFRDMSKTDGRGGLALSGACFAVVILRSHVGMAVSFSWKGTAALALGAVVAVVLGKMAGGILAARFGRTPTVVASLLAAAGCYLLGELPFLGILALFFFNMTMPITLYALASQWRKLPGFSFGLLTFGLFLGFLPSYLGMNIGLSPEWLGALGSVLSLALLWLGGKAVGHDRVSG